MKLVRTNVIESCKFPLGLVAEKLSGRSYQVFENIPCVVSNGQMVPCLPAEIVPEEKSSNGVEYAARHLEHVLHDLLYRGVGNGHVNGPNGDHEVESGHDVPGILYKFVEVREVVSVLDVCVV